MLSHDRWHRSKLWHVGVVEACTASAADLHTIFWFDGEESKATIAARSCFAKLHISTCVLRKACMLVSQHFVHIIWRRHFKLLNITVAKHTTSSLLAQMIVDHTCCCNSCLLKLRCADSCRNLVWTTGILPADSQRSLNVHCFAH